MTTSPPENIPPATPRLADTQNPPIRLGLTQWSHNAWQRKFYPKGSQSGERLARYAEVFNTVEGNTTFYASPSPETVLRWHQSTPDNFRFTFKFPRQITHDFQLSNCRDLVSEFIHLLKPLHEKTALWKIQLPSAFGPESLGSLAQFIRALPEHCHAGVEVRHPAFFAKGDAERALNRLLIETQADRIIMDSRPVFRQSPIRQPSLMPSRKNPKFRFMPLRHPILRWFVSSGIRTSKQMMLSLSPGLPKSRPGWLRAKHLI